MGFCDSSSHFQKKKKILATLELRVCLREGRARHYPGDCSPGEKSGLAKVELFRPWFPGWTMLACDVCYSAHLQALSTPLPSPSEDQIQVCSFADVPEEVSGLLSQLENLS